MIPIDFSGKVALVTGRAAAASSVSPTTRSLPVPGRPGCSSPFTLPNAVAAFFCSKRARSPA